MGRDSWHITGTLNQSPSEPPKKSRWEFLKWFGSFISVLALALTVCQIRIAEDTERQQLRAYLVDVGITLDVCPLAIEGKEIRPRTLYIDVKNGGQTPAYIVTAYLGQKPYDHKIGGKPPANLVISDQEMFKSDNKNIILPGSNGNFFWEKEFVGEQVVADMKEHRKNNLYQGRIEYLDVFKNSHTVDFCWTLALPNPCSPDATGTNFDRCPRGIQEREPPSSWWLTHLTAPG